MLVGAVTFVLDLLPSMDPPDFTAGLSSLSSVFSYLGWANQYTPVAEALVLLEALIAVFLGLYLFRAVVWVLTKAHVLGGSSD